MVIAEFIFFMQIHVLTGGFLLWLNMVGVWLIL